MKKYKNYYCDICKLAYPILLNYAVTIAFEFMDQAIVGHYSTECYAAVGIIAKIISMITGSIGIFSMSYHIVAARMIGMKDLKGFYQSFYEAMKITHITGAFLVIVTIISRRFICGVLLGFTGNVLEEGIRYLVPAGITIWLNLVIFICSAFFRNLHNTKVSLKSTLVSTIINLFFDYSFVYGKFGFPGLGGSGAAWGSILGLSCGVLVYIYEFRKTQPKTVVEKNRAKLRKDMLHQYVPLLAQDLMECTIFPCILSAIIARLDTKMIASYQVVEVIMGFVFLPIYAYAKASMTYLVQMHEAKDLVEERLYFLVTIRLGLLTTIILGTITMVFQIQLCSLILMDQSVLTGVQTIFLLGLILQLIRTITELQKSYLQGVGYDKFVVKIVVYISFSSLIYIIPCVLNYHVKGVYLALIISQLKIMIHYYKKVKCVMLRTEYNLLK